MESSPASKESSGMSRALRKNVLPLVFLAALFSLVLFLSFKGLFPWVYGIKEPRFAFPVESVKIITTRRDIPVRMDEYGSGEFGARRKGNRKHSGLDLQAELESPVYASKSGWAKTCFIPDGYGNLVVIDHPGGWQTRYGHLLRCAIEKTMWVRQGDVIGFVGKTGNADLDNIVPHLHFEIRYNGEVRNPADEFVRRQ